MSNYTTQYLPDYTVGVDAYLAVPEVVGSARVAIVGGRKALTAAGGRLATALEGSSIEVVGTFWYGGRAAYSCVDDLCSTTEIANADAIFVVGGGRAVDTCKIVAHRLGKPLYTFPTIASNCSPVSCISIMYNEDGAFKEIVQLQVPPVHCFIDTRVIAEAPEIYLWAGIGDTLAKSYEVTFSMRGDSLTYGPMLGRAISRMCNRPLIECALEAYEDCRANRDSDALTHVVLNIVVSTGLVSGLVGADYNSALAHALFYGLTTIPSIEREHCHGEVVSYGVLVQLVMDGDSEQLELLIPFYRRLGLPTCLADLGLTIEDDFDKVLAATEANQELRHVPYPVTRDLIWKAIVDLEAFSASCDVPPSPVPMVPEE